MKQLIKFRNLLVLFNLFVLFMLFFSLTGIAVVATDADDSCTGAVFVPRTSIGNGVIADSNDVDWWYTDANTLGTFKIHLFGPANSNLDLAVYNSCGSAKQLLCSSTGSYSTEHCTINPTQIGNYYTQVTGFFGNVGEYFLSVCADACNIEGQAECADSTTRRVCTYDQSSGCLKWVTSACAGGSCSSGSCSGSCTDECTVAGSTHCSATESRMRQTCGQWDDDPCKEWGNDQWCGNNCINNQCSGIPVGTCTPTCSSLSTTTCANPFQQRTCGYYQLNECLGWGNPLSCQYGCANGACLSQPACTSQCQTPSATQCVDSERYQRCGDFNSDGCLEWNQPIICEYGCSTATNSCNPTSSCVDVDHDTYGQSCSTGLDCDDTNANIHPSAIETCNAKDDDCDGQTDEGLNCPVSHTPYVEASTHDSCAHFYASFFGTPYSGVSISGTGNGIGTWNGQTDSQGVFEKCSFTPGYVDWKASYQGSQIQSGSFLLSFSSAYPARGYVRDGSNNPVSGAVVQLRKNCGTTSPLDWNAITDDAGYYSASVSSGTTLQQVVTTKTGFQSSSSSCGGAPGMGGALYNIVLTRLSTPVEICDNHIDDDSNGLIDCKDTAPCAQTPVCQQYLLANFFYYKDANGNYLWEPSEEKQRKLFSEEDFKASFHASILNVPAKATAELRLYNAETGGARQTLRCFDIIPPLPHTNYPPMITNEFSSDTCPLIITLDAGVFTVDGTVKIIGTPLADRPATWWVELVINGNPVLQRQRLMVEVNDQSDLIVGSHTLKVYTSHACIPPEGAVAVSAASKYGGLGLSGGIPAPYYDDESGIYAVAPDSLTSAEISFTSGYNPFELKSFITDGTKPQMPLTQLFDVLPAPGPEESYVYVWLVNLEPAETTVPTAKAVLHNKFLNVDDIPVTPTSMDSSDFGQPAGIPVYYYQFPVKRYVLPLPGTEPESLFGAKIILPIKTHSLGNKGSIVSVTSTIKGSALVNSIANDLIKPFLEFAQGKSKKLDLKGAAKGIPLNPSYWASVLSIFNSRKVATLISMDPSEPYICPTLHSPADFDVYDLNENHLGLNSAEEIENNIPGSYYITSSSGAQQVVLTDLQNAYKVNTIAESPGEIHLSNTMASSGTFNHQVFPEITISSTTHTLTNLFTSDQTGIDADNDGIFEKTISATSQDLIETRCFDDIDNDANGLADCQDLACTIQCYEPPVAVILNSPKVIEGKTTLFSGEGSTKGSSDSLTYQWNIDGQSSSQNQKLYAPLERGRHTISLSVQNSRNMEDTAVAGAIAFPTFITTHKSGLMRLNPSNNPVALQVRSLSVAMGETLYVKANVTRGTDGQQYSLNAKILDSKGNTMLSDAQGTWASSPSFSNDGSPLQNSWSFTLPNHAQNKHGEYQSDANTILLWHLDESGTVALDASAFHNNGAIYGTLVGEGRFGSARDFRGVSSDYITVAQNSNLQSGTATYEAWVYARHHGLSSTPALIVNKYLYPGTNGRQLAINKDGKPYALASIPSGSYDTTAQNAIPLNTWTHLAAVFDQTNSKIQIYVNGLLSGESTLANGTDANTSVYIGKFSGNSAFFDGTIDEVRISNKARAESELQPNLNINPTPIGFEANNNYYVQLQLLDGSSQVVDIENYLIKVNPDDDMPFLVYDWFFFFVLTTTTHDSNSDNDNDGLSNYQEYALFTNPSDPDSDGGGTLDGDEINSHHDPLDASDDPHIICIDADGDGYGTNCAVGSDCNDANNAVHPNALETCFDNIDNNCDLTVDENCNSVCGDGIIQPDNLEQCDDHNTNNGDGCTAACKTEFCGDHLINNAGTEQCDGTTFGSTDTCDDIGSYLVTPLSCTNACQFDISACQLDSDGDGVSDTVDNCLFNANAGQADADADNIGDWCDTCAQDSFNDVDGDLICGDEDNCPVHTNAAQEDYDGDGIGDLCDPQTCGNTIKEGTEQCDGAANSGITHCDQLGAYLNTPISCNAACQFNTSVCILRTDCNDGADNDVDGATDYPNDFSCASAIDNDEANPKAQCQDGIDNDADGVVDYPADFSCTSKQDNDETNPKTQCQDGIDNDADGSSDLVDPGCANAQDTSERNSAVQCDNGIDDDADGRIDFGTSPTNDPGCVSAVDTTELNAVCGNGVIETGEQCDDGNTNNNDACSNLCQITTQQLFADTFEAGASKWTETNEFDWNIESAAEVAVPGHLQTNKVMHADQCSTSTGCVLTSLPINTANTKKLTLSFNRYVDNDIDAKEFLRVQVYNGNKWTTLKEWTHNNGDDNQWHAESFDVTPYLNSKFQLRFVTKESSTAEEVEVDDVKIVG